MFDRQFYYPDFTVIFIAAVMLALYFTTSVFEDGSFRNRLIPAIQGCIPMRLCDEDRIQPPPPSTRAYLEVQNVE